MEPTRLSTGSDVGQPVATEGPLPGQSTIDLTDPHGAGTPDAADGAEPLAIRALRELNEQKDAFLQTVAHDLHSPLLVIERFASILRDLGDELSADDRRAYAHRVVEASKRLQRQLTELLDLDRL